MGFGLAKAVLLVELSLLCFTAVFGEDIEVVPPIPPRHHGYYNHPAAAPTQPPSPHHHHHHHHSHPPTQPPSHHHHGHPPSHAPVYPPMHAPSHPPAVHPPPPAKPLPPAHPPPPAYPPTHHFPRSFVAVQGVVYCKKACKYAGVDTLLGATPLLGATVKLQCNNTKWPLVVKGTTDKNGYFFVKAPKTITNYGAHKCKLFLDTSPDAACGFASNLHGGLNGGVLRPEKPFVADKLPFVLFTSGPFTFEPKCKH